jgi:hypothetical protein
MHTRPVPYTSGGMLPDNPSAKNELSSAVRLSTMVSHPSPILTIQSVESSARWATNCNDGPDGGREGTECVLRRSERAALTSSRCPRT